MNFKFGRFFYKAINYIIGTFFSILGIFNLILPWSSFLQKSLTKFIMGNTLLLSFFGLAFLLMGIAIFAYTFFRARPRYLHVQTGPQAVSIDEKLVHQYLDIYWKEHFPTSSIPFNLHIKKRALHIYADLPALPLSEQKMFLEGVKHDFSDLFQHVLGYPYDIHLFASFQKEKSV